MRTENANMDKKQGVGYISEHLYVYSGLNRDRWPGMSVMLIKSYFDNPELLDALEDKFVEAFYHYYMRYRECHIYKRSIN